MIKSAWGIIYYIDERTGEPKFLILKRYALSKKIEWIAPKWKIQPGETEEEAAIREIFEETGIKKEFLKYRWPIWKVNIHLESEEKWVFDKSIQYFLFEYTWDPNKLKIIDWEWYLWIYKWATIKEISNLVYYPELRNLFVKAYNKIVNKQKLL